MQQLYARDETQQTLKPLMVARDDADAAVRRAKAKHSPQAEITRLWKVSSKAKQALRNEHAVQANLFWVEICQEIEALRKKGNDYGQAHELYKYLKSADLETHRPLGIQYICDESGNLLREIAEIRSRWMRHFKALLNGDGIPLDSRILNHLVQRPTDESLGAMPTISETEDALRKLKNWKA